jgi:hypothetical protein
MPVMYAASRHSVHELEERVPVAGARRAEAHEVFTGEFGAGTGDEIGAGEQPHTVKADDGDRDDVIRLSRW